MDFAPVDRRGAVGQPGVRRSFPAAAASLHGRLWIIRRSRGGHDARAGAAVRDVERALRLRVCPSGQISHLVD